MSDLYAPLWTPPEAAALLAEAWAADRGEEAAPDPVTLEALARTLDADPDYLEATWEAWQDELNVRDWDDARYWLDVVVIGGLANP